MIGGVKNVGKNLRNGIKIFGKPLGIRIWNFRVQIGAGLGIWEFEFGIEIGIGIPN